MTTWNGFPVTPKQTWWQAHSKKIENAVGNIIGWFVILVVVALIIYNAYAWASWLFAFGPK
jgi:hypothetical protein